MAPHVILACSHVLCGACVDIMLTSDLEVCPVCTGPLGRPVPDSELAEFLDSTVELPSCKRTQLQYLSPDTPFVGMKHDLEAAVLRERSEYVEAMGAFLSRVRAHERKVLAAYDVTVHTLRKEVSAAADVYEVDAATRVARTAAGLKLHPETPPFRLGTLPRLPQVDLDALAAMVESDGKGQTAALLKNWRDGERTRADPELLASALTRVTSAYDFCALMPQVTSWWDGGRGTGQGPPLEIICALEHALQMLFGMGHGVDGIVLQNALDSVPVCNAVIAALWNGPFTVGTMLTIVNCNWPEEYEYEALLDFQSIRVWLMDHVHEIVTWHDVNNFLIFIGCNTVWTPFAREELTAIILRLEELPSGNVSENLFLLQRFIFADYIGWGAGSETMRCTLFAKCAGFVPRADGQLAHNFRRTMIHAAWYGTIPPALYSAMLEWYIDILSAASPAFRLNHANQLRTDFFDLLQDITRTGAAAATTEQRTRLKAHVTTWPGIVTPEVIAMCQ